MLKKKTGIATKELKKNPEKIKKVLAQMNALKRQKEKELRIIDGIILHIQKQCPHKSKNSDKSGVKICDICGRGLPEEL